MTPTDRSRSAETGTRRTLFSHPADQYFEWLADYLHHLVEVHEIEETPELWRSGRDRFDALHAEAHDVHIDGYPASEAPS